MARAPTRQHLLGPGGDLPPLTAADAEWVKGRVRAEGFDLAGLAPCGLIRHPEAYRDVLARGWAGEMHYLARTLASRLDARRLFEGARTAIMGAISYWRDEPAPPDAPAVADGPRGRIARYGWSRDYHLVLKRKLHRVADGLRQRWPTCRTQTCVDSAPIHERDLAAAAGLGWIGKHTLLLNRSTGSWLLLGAIVTDLDLPPDAPQLDRCGACTACLVACPTGALDPARPYTLDASRCLSYTTIELREPEADEPGARRAGGLPDVPADLAARTGPWLFGCDVCQEVCPYNRAPAPARDPDLAVALASTAPRLADVLAWSEPDRVAWQGGSAVKRASLAQLQRNARVCLAAAPPDGAGA